MTTHTIDKIFPWQVRITPKVEAVMRMFGLDVDRLAETSPRHACTIELRAGQICYITGPSGSGKSVLFRELMAVAGDNAIDLDSIRLSKNRAVIDCFDGNFIEALRILSIAGLSDVFAVLNKPAYLSEGQKYRFRLAKALSSIAADRGAQPSSAVICGESRATSHEPRIIFADEFCSNLDRITAAVIAYQIRKFARRHNVSFVLASSHEDILADLQPDVLVVKHLNAKTEVIYKNFCHSDPAPIERKISSQNGVSQSIPYLAIGALEKSLLYSEIYAERDTAILACDFSPRRGRKLNSQGCQPLEPK